jgi:hypothetical protein
MLVEKASAVFIEGWRFSERRLARSKAGKAAVNKERGGGAICETAFKWKRELWAKIYNTCR